MADDGVRDRRPVHDRVDLGHVEIVGRAAHLGELVLDADIDDEGARRHEMAGGDQFADPDLIGDVGEHRAQTALVAPVGRRGDAIDPAHGIALERGVDDAPIAVGCRVMRLVDHQEVERGQLVEIARARQRRHHREGDLSSPRLLLRIDDRGRDLRVHPAELAAVLSGQLVAVGEHAGLGARALRGFADHATDDPREHDRFAGSSRGHAEGVSVFVERADAALDELLLAGTQQHGSLTAPRTGARPAAAWRAGTAEPAAALPHRARRP